MLDDQIIVLDQQHIWHPYASMDNPPPAYIVASASGVHLKLRDGRYLLDGMSSWWCTIHGYNHPRLNAALQQQMQAMSHVMFGGLTHEPAVELAVRLANMTPAGLDKLFFSDSGSVAVEVAIKIAIQYWHAVGQPQKNRLLALRHGYHGDTFGAMAVCDPVTGMHQLFRDTLPQHLFVPAPPAGFERACTTMDLAPLAQLLEQHQHELAALILEPIVQGAGGMRFYSPQWLRQAADLCREHHVLLIADEIATGFGRSGALFACNHADISPDIMCLGKAITGGTISFAATLTHGHIASTISNGTAGCLMHGPTFMGNPLACSVALASLELLQSNNWQQQVNDISEWLNIELSPAQYCDYVKHVRVLGAIGVIELYQPVNLARIQAMFVASGIWVRPFGRLVYLMPPYIISKEELEQLCRLLLQVLASYHKSSHHVSPMS